MYNISVNVKQSSSEEDQKKLEEYNRSQQNQVQRFYSQSSLDYPVSSGFEDEYYQGQRSQAPRYVPEVQVAKTIAVKSEVYLMKHTLRMVPLGATSYGLTFKYTTEVPAVIYIFQCAKQTSTPQEITANIQIVHEPYHLQHEFKVPVTKETDFAQQNFVIDLIKFQIAQLTQVNPSENYYPLIIQMQALEPAPENKRQFYYCQFQLAKNVLSLNCFRSKLEASGQGYILNEVYGIHDSCLSEKSEKECAVCLTEKINTMILPCKHMVLCHVCCDDMRRRSQRCPICRGEIQSFMRLENANAQQQPQQQPQQQQPQQQQSQQGQPQQQPNSNQSNRNSQSQDQGSTAFRGQGVQIGGSQ